MIASGTLLQNRYRVVRQLGQGGMGAVYVATDERFNSTVAIKQTFFFDEPELRRAFEREAVLLNHLRHPALPRVSDHFVEEAGQFLVMEFIEGADLGELLKARGGWFPVAEVLAWGEELLDALEYLHTQEPSVVHRDIKPQNIKRTTQGRMVLLDFGLAKGNPTRSGMTATGSVLGYSPTYAPLEQVQGTGTDARSDLYSLGATLYHLLTGEPPVDALTRAAAVVNGEADPLRPAHVVQPHVPVPVSRCIRRAMSQKAALRPQTAAEMREMLRQAAAAGTQTASAGGQDTEATVVESASWAKGSGLSYHFGETTLDAMRVKAQPYQTANGAQHFEPEPERRSFGATAKLLVVAAVIAACVAVAYPLLSAKAPEKAPAAPAAQADGPHADTQNEAQGSDERDGRRSAPAPAPTLMPSSTADSPPQQNGWGSAGPSDSPKQAAPAESKSPVVIVVNPTPAPTVDTQAEADEAARRAEEERRRQQQQQQQQAPPPPPYGAPPPPPYGAPPPPPPGGRPMPPPPGRPPQ